MNMSVTALLGVLLLIGMTLSANGQDNSTAADSSPARRHGNPDYVDPVAMPILARREGQLADPHTQVSRNRVGWLRRLLGTIRNPDNRHAPPVVYEPTPIPPPVSTTDNSFRSFRNQLYSTGWPGLDPLRTKWLFGRSEPVIEPLAPPRP
ncbi:hypothetical protein [Spirosoma rhododendri]|uniref:Uncharacterized protein n=1 Tax=Spirosoma rhododendri TaxID=2728024 RepID=A0A7L5DR69_9BACT|nr:hypothetical protein [Spirosoma rhododendri]QJD80625.1 hypothetical protein HH216_21055 [Spirosoma rhododendri]